MPTTVQRFLDISARQADAPAVDTAEGAVSYGEIERRVRRLAAAIVEHGAARKVLIRAHQGEDAYTAMLASLMAGAVYCPINVSAPNDLQSLIVSRFEPDIILADEDHGGGTGQALAIRRPEGAASLDEPVSGSELAYVIFTSGSTGVPKGVMIQRQALDHYVDWAIPALEAGPGERISQHPNIGFDLSVIDIYAALCSGACLVPLQSASDRMLPAKAIRERGISIWISVPSVIDLMQRARQVTHENFSGLKRLFFCGEPLLPSHLEWVFEANPGIAVINAYGPTEATVSCTALNLSAEHYRDMCDASVAIGDAIPGMRLELIGGESEDEGELVISGPQVAVGYWQDPEQTNEKFRALDGQAEPSYFTGDWAERRDGQVYFRQRMDRQIKRRGYRLELGEVDEVLRRAGGDTVYTVSVDDTLVSFVEGDAERIDVTALREAALLRLPAYAVPDEIRIIDRLPRNANDKIDALELMEGVKDGR